MILTSTHAGFGEQVGMVAPFLRILIGLVLDCEHMLFKTASVFFIERTLDKDFLVVFVLFFCILDDFIN